MTLIAVLIGLGVLIVGITLGAFLATVGRANGVEAIPDSQYSRNRQFSRALHHEGAWIEPRTRK